MMNIIRGCARLCYFACISSFAFSVKCDRACGVCLYFRSFWPQCTHSWCDSIRWITSSTYIYKHILYSKRMLIDAIKMYTLNVILYFWATLSASDWCDAYVARVGKPPSRHKHSVLRSRTWNAHALTHSNPYTTSTEACMYIEHWNCLQSGVHAIATVVST